MDMFDYFVYLISFVKQAVMNINQNILALMNPLKVESHL